MPKITYYNGSTDAYSGQVNMEAAIYVDGQIVGAAEYVLYNGELTISDIQIRPEWRRKGMGSRLIKYIKQENPDYKYVPSLKTELGAAFIHKDLPLDERCKAKYVYESLDFERGKDPKKAMGIGISKELLIQKIKRTSKYRVPEKYCNRYFYYQDSRGKRGWDNLSILSLEELKDLYHLQTGIRINESLDFERGSDPKKSMGIGRSVYCKHLYDRFVKDLTIAFPDLHTTFLKEDEIEGYYIEIPLDPYSEHGMNILDRITRKVIREKYKGKLVFITEDFLEKYYKNKWPEESQFYGDEDLKIKIL